MIWFWFAIHWLAPLLVALAVGTIWFHLPGTGDPRRIWLVVPVLLSVIVAVLAGIAISGILHESGAINPFSQGASFVRRFTWLFDAFVLDAWPRLVAGLSLGLAFAFFGRPSGRPRRKQPA